MSGDPSVEAPRQQTIKTPFTLEGTGLHSGQPALAEVRPADADTGILFRRADIRGAPEVKADVELVSGVEWETVLGPDDSCVRTVEHLLAALAAHRVDNAEILLRGSEPPARDGSSADWCSAIDRAGIVAQDAEAAVIEVREAFSVEDGASRYTVSPYDGYRVSAGIEFDHPVIRRQFASAEIDTLDGVGSGRPAKRVAVR